MTPLLSTGQNTVRTYFTTSTTRTHTYSSQWNQHNKVHYHSWTPLSPRTRQHLQHHSLLEAHPHRSISTLGQQPPHHCQTKCLQHPSTQGKNSIFHTGQNGQGTPTHKDSTTTLSGSRMGPQPVATQIHPP